MNVVLVHGWGGNADIWNAVRARLDPALTVHTIDFGYFGAVPPAPSFAAPVLAVGHSLGALWWLLNETVPWRRLLCIDGFPRFAATADFPGVAPRVLERMRRQLARDPAAVLADFHQRCGTACPSGAPAADRLAAGLALLAASDGRAALAARRNDIWALAGADDPIVPRAMSAAAFAALPPGRLEFVEASGHRLPLSAPDVCAHWIERLAA